MVDQIPVLGIPVLNRVDLLEQSLQSLDFPVKDLILINNDGETSLEPNSHHPFVERFHVLNMPSNLGVAASWNLIIKSFPHEEYWVLGSNDTRWVGGSMERVFHESSKDLLLLSSQAWSTFSIGSEMIKSVGLFDENYYPAYYEDTDYMERIRILGLESRVKQLHFEVESYDAATTMKSSEQFMQRAAQTKESNRQYFMNKIYKDEDELDIMGFDWSLQRRIDNDWTRTQ